MISCTTGPILEYTVGMTYDEVIAMIRHEGFEMERKGSVIEIRLRRSVTAADIDDTGGVPDEAFNPRSFLGAAALSGREMYRNMGGKEISAGLSTIVVWGQIMEAVHWLKDDPESGVVKVVKRGGEPFIITFADEAKAVRFTDALHEDPMGMTAHQPGTWAGMFEGKNDA